MLHKQFANYLFSTGISTKSLRNYKSDISHFLSWSVTKLKGFGTYISDLNELVPFLSKDFASEYQGNMVQNSVPFKTINRRLSTLRHLSRFLISSQIIDFDFMGGIQNLGLSGKRNAIHTGSLIEDFANHLQDQKVSKNTIKNYTSDVRQFLSWLESNNHAHSA